MDVLEYKKAVDNVKAAYSTTQRALNDLDVIYADLEN